MLCTGIEGIYALFVGGPSAKVCLSAKFGVVVPKASILNSLGGCISQSRFICQILCTDIQGISALFVGGPLAKDDLLLGTRSHSPVALAVYCCCSPCVIITLNNNNMKS